MIEKEKHRTISLDLDVSPIASELASKRKLSTVLSELLRKEYGVNQEEDILNSQINELNRQQSQIEKDLQELKLIQLEKSRIQNIKQERIELQNEFNLLNLRMKQEIEEMRDQPNSSFEIDEKGLEPHQIMVALAKEKGRIRIEITNRFNHRRNFIINRLQELKNEENGVE